MNIGEIRYRKYEERVLMNSSFSIDELFRIILEDEDFVWFNIVDAKGNILLSTWYPDTDKGARLIRVPKVERDEEILGIDYNAYRTPQYIYKKKVTWRAGVYTWNRKKDAQGYAEREKRNARFYIEQAIK